MRPANIDVEIEKLRRGYLDIAADIAEVRLTLALRRSVAEAKNNFNPSQPRAPRGRQDGGQWVDTDGGRAPNEGYRRQSSTRADASPRFIPAREDNSHEAAWEPVAREAAKISRKVGAFVERNRDPITRFLGAVQAAGGLGEMLGGVGVVGGGVATSEVGVGVVVAGMGAWMVTNGYDNFSTGLQILMTGQPHDTRLRESLRSFGLSEEEATLVEIGLAGSVTVGASKLSRPALENAAKVGLAKRAADAWAHEPLKVEVGGRSVFLERNIATRGDAWEVFDTYRTGFRRTPRGFPVFDQFDDISETAVSNKVLDLTGTSYSVVDRTKVFERVRDYINAAANFRRGRRGNYLLSASQIKSRELHLLVPAGESLPAQALQLEAARAYAASRGVVLQVYYGR